MTTIYVDELRTRLEAATRSTDDHDRDATIKALTDAERHPQAAAECVVPIVDLFAGTVGTSTASRLVEPILAAGTGSVRDRALAALDAVADARPEASAGSAPSCDSSRRSTASLRRNSGRYCRSSDVADPTRTTTR